jgi:hypothetical protein
VMCATRRLHVRTRIARSVSRSLSSACATLGSSMASRFTTTVQSAAITAS